MQCQFPGILLMSPGKLLTHPTKSLVPPAGSMPLSWHSPREPWQAPQTPQHPWHGLLAFELQKEWWHTYECNYSKFTPWEGLTEDKQLVFCDGRVRMDIYA
eukprot:scaffold29270_cov21-Tisochrysis_lutea.AAC.1